MAANRENLILELQNLLRLTNAEVAVATIRRAQARTEALQKELADNADKARERAALLTQAIRELGGAPDVVNPLLGRLTAFTKAQLEMAQAFPTALLGDLQLEHQLRERARFVRTMAENVGEGRVVQVMERLDLAHTKTIEWLETRLNEVAQGGQSQLRPLPSQVAVGAVRQALVFPLRGLGIALNRGAGLVEGLRGVVPTQVTDTASNLLDRAGRATDRTIDLTVEGTRKAGDKVEKTAAKATHLAASDLPIQLYDSLSGDAIMARLGDMESAAEITQILTYEKAHKNRKGVTEAAQSRLTSLATPTAS